MAWYKATEMAHENERYTDTAAMALRAYAKHRANCAKCKAQMRRDNAIARAMSDDLPYFDDPKGWMM